MAEDCVSYFIEEDYLDQIYYNLSCGVTNSNTNICCLGTTEGVLSFFNDKTNKFYKQISSSLIHNLDWINNTNVVVCSKDFFFTIYDIIKDTTLVLEKHNDLTRYVKKTSYNMFFSCSKDGTSIGWDIRSYKPSIILKHQSGVTCIENNFLNPYILYTCSVPGSNINTWDLRYTKSGNYYSESNLIVNSSCIRELRYFDGNLYGKDNYSNIFKISETGKLSNKLMEGNVNGSIGSFFVSNKFNTLFYVTNNKLYSNNGDVQHNLHNDVSGICQYGNQDIILYNKNNIIFCKVQPSLIKKYN